jgi:predicted ATPase
MQSGMLNHIKIDGFKSIRSLDLELKSLNILVGSNGAGKSNLIQFFRFMRMLVDTQLQLFVAQQGGANAILHFGTKTTKTLNIALALNPNAYHAKLASTVNDELLFTEEEGQYLYTSNDGSNKTTHYSLEGKKESGIKNSNERAVGYIEKYIKSWKVYHFHDTSETALFKRECALNGIPSLAWDAANLASFLHYLKGSYRVQYNNIVAIVKLVAPYFHDFYLEPNPKNPNSIRLRWLHVEQEDAVFSASQLSDGTLRFICLATLFLQPEDLLPKTIIIDEPELGLHPYAIQLLASMMKSCSTKNQVIAATQSVTLLNQFTFEDLIVVDRDKGASVFKRPTQEEADTWMEDYGLGELWEKNWLGGTP